MIFATVIISLNSLSFSFINIYSHVFKFLVLQIATVFLSVDCSVGSYVHVFWSCGIWVYNTYLDLILTTVNPGTEDSNSQLSHQSHFHGSTMSHETWLQSLQADINGFWTNTWTWTLLNQPVRTHYCRHAQPARPINSIFATFHTFFILMLLFFNTLLY